MGTGPSGPRVRAEGGQSRWPGRGLPCGLAWPWVPPRGSGGPEGSGRPARPPTSKSDVTESLRRGGVRWWPCLLGTAVCPPARPLGDAGEEGSSGVPCQGLQAHGGQPPAGRRWRGPACCPARPLPGPRPLPHSTPSPPSELPLPAGREAAGGGLVNPGVLETAQVRREQCPVVAPRGWGATPRHQPHVAKPLACPRFRPAGPWGLRPGTGTSSLDTEAIDGGIKAACVGTERRASPCPAARHRHSCQVAWAGTARQWGLCGDEDRPARGRTALSLASGETREARPPPGAAVGASRGVPRSGDMAEQEERAPRAPGQTRGHSGDDSLRTRGPVPVNTPQRGTLPGPRTATGGAGGSRERTAGTRTATSLQSVATARPLSPMSPTVSPRLLGAERMDVATLASLGH